MKQRMQLKKKFKINKNSWIIVLIATVFLCVRMIGIKLNKELKYYASIETTKFITSLVNSNIDSNFLQQFPIDDILISDISSDKDTYYTDINSNLLNKILSSALYKVEDNLIAIENGNLDNIKLPNSITNNEYNKLKEGIIIVIPTGTLFNNAALANLGPKIPVRLKLLGDVTGKTKIKAKDYGINNTLLEVYIQVNVKEQIVFPISTDTIGTSVNILIATRLINGKIPDYLLSNIDSYTKN